MTYTELAVQLSQVGIAIDGLLPKIKALKEATNNVPATVVNAVNGVAQKLVDVNTAIDAP